MKRITALYLAVIAILLLVISAMAYFALPKHSKRQAKK